MTKGPAGGRRRGCGGRRGDLPRRLEEIITPAVRRLAEGDEARAYAAWARAVGPPVAGGTRPKAFRRGQLTVECASSVWASELTYLGPRILRRMSEVAPGHPVERFRFVVGHIPGPEADDLPGGAVPVAGRTIDAAGEGSGRGGARRGEPQGRPADGAADELQTASGAVRDARLRAAIEQALRRSSEESPEAPGGGPSRG